MPGLRLVLASQTLLYPAEKLLLSREHPVYGSGLLFGHAADRHAEPEWLVIHVHSERRVDLSFLLPHQASG